MYQNFHIPKKFHDASRVVGGAENRKLTESFDIGCRLMCGIESAYQRSKAENVKKSGSSKSSSQYLREIEMKNNMKSEIFYSSQHRENSDFQAMIDTLLNTNDIKEKEEKMQRNKSPSTGDINNSNSNSNQNSSLSEMKESKNLLKKYHSLSRTLEPDSDSWMFLSPEELDAEMEARVMKYKGNDAGNKTSTVLQETEKGILRNDLLPPKNSESGQQNTNNDVHQKDNKSVFNDTTETNQLQKMLDGMKAFISTKSDVGGIGSSKVVKNTPSSAEDKTVIEEKNKSEIKQNYSNSNSNISSDNNAGDGDDTNEELEIDMEKLMGYINNTNISSSIPIITTHSTEQKKEDHSLNLENPPLAHYFYDEDLIEMSSDDSSDDSDDEDEEEFESQNNQKNTRNEVSILSENIRIIDHDGTGHTETVENIRNARKTKETDLISTIGIRTVQLATASSSARGSKAQRSRSAQLNAQGTDRREDTAVGGDIMSSVVGISKLTLLSPAASESSSPSCVTAEESIIISSNNSNSSSLSLSHQGSDISNSKPLSDSGHSQHRPSSSAALCDTRQSSDPGATHSSSRTGAADRTAQSVESGDESDDGDSFYDDSETDSDDEPLDEPTAGGRGGEGGGARSMNPSYEHDPLPSHVESGGNDVEEEEENVGAYLKEYEVRNVPIPCIMRTVQPTLFLRYSSLVRIQLFSLLSFRDFVSVQLCCHNNGQNNQLTIKSAHLI